MMEREMGRRRLWARRRLFLVQAADGRSAELGELLQKCEEGGRALPDGDGAVLRGVVGHGASYRRESPIGSTRPSHELIG